MTESSDREGMFTDPRLLSGRGRILSVVTCTRCGCLVVDTEAHERMHPKAVTNFSRGYFVGGAD
jgi:hypothetical protein